MVSNVHDSNDAVLGPAGCPSLWGRFTRRSDHFDSIGSGVGGMVLASIILLTVTGLHAGRFLFLPILEHFEWEWSWRDTFHR